MARGTVGQNGILKLRLDRVYSIMGRVGLGRVLGVQWYSMKELYLEDTYGQSL